MYIGRTPKQRLWCAFFFLAEKQIHKNYSNHFKSGIYFVIIIANSNFY